MTTYAYPDAYLSRFCTTNVETRALANVALFGTFPAAWTERLTIVQAYIIACLENQADADNFHCLIPKTKRISPINKCIKSMQWVLIGILIRKAINHYDRNNQVI